MSDRSFRKSRTIGSAWSVSIAIHLVLLLAVWRLVSSTVPTLEHPVLELRLGETTPAESLDVAEFSLSSGGGELAAGPTLDQMLASASILSEVQTPLSPGEFAGLEGTGTGDQSHGVAPGKGLGNDRGLGFFGTEGQGESVVFVVDMSGSMYGYRFDRSRRELVRAIHQLKPSQKFYVIFFTLHALPLYYPRSPRHLVDATPAAKKGVTRWISERQTGPGTDPAEALQMALQLQPDVIYFLTDGEFSERSREICREYNTRGTVIHTIALQSRAGVPLLEAIAHDHRGTFRYVK